MAIIAAYTSTGDLPSPSFYVPNTSSGTGKATDVKESMVTTSAITEPFGIPLGSKIADLWTALTIYRRFNPSGTYNIMRWYDTSYSPTQPLFAIGQLGTSGEFQLLAWNGTALIAASPEKFTLPLNAAVRLDLHLKIADTGGVAQFYVDGTLVATATSDDTKLTPAVTGIDKAEFAGPVTGGDTNWSAIFFADEDTRAMQMIQMLPTGNSTANTAWSGSYTAVDETGFDDADNNIATASGQNKGYTHGALPSTYASGYEVKAVILSGRMAKGQNHSMDIKTLLRVGGVNYIGASFGAELTTKAKQIVMPLNPATGLPWTYAEAASEFGVACV